MGWIIAFLLAASCLGGLYFIARQPRAVLEIALAAILVGLAGYAWQGQPEMPGKPIVAGQPAG